MTSFNFIPRKVQKKVTGTLPQSVPSTSASVPPLVAPSSIKGKEKDKSPLSEEDYLTLVSLSLSDYALYSDSDLRFKVDTAEEGCTHSILFQFSFGYSA